MALNRIVLWSLPVVVLGGLIAWRFNTERAKTGQQMQQGQQRRGASPAVEIALAGPKVLERKLEIVGTAEAPFVARISPRVSGRIETVAVREGDAVIPGQVLVTVDPGEIEGQVLQQQAAVSEARSRLAQAELTTGANTIGVESQIRQQQATVTGAQAQLKQTQAATRAQIAAAQADVTDADARIRAAEASVKNAQASQEAASANLRNAEARYERIRKLFEGGFIAAQDVDDARTQIEVQHGLLDVAKAQVSANQSAVASAQAQRRAAMERVDVTRRQGNATLANQQAAVEQARAGLSTATANRAQTPAYLQNLSALRASVASAEAQLRQAESRRTDTVLKSPIEGTITERTADPGTIASPGTAVVTVQYLKWLYVTASAPVEESSRIKVGDSVAVIFDSFKDETFSGKVIEINKAADPQSRQFTFRVRLENPGERIRPGMFARLNVVVERVDGKVVVPISAVRTNAEGSKVTVLDSEDKATTRDVELGFRDTDNVQITKGLEPGDRVVTLTYSPVKDGQKVSIGKPDDGKDGGKGEGRRSRESGGGRGQ